jgi:mannose-6-phosphate isomerase
MANSDNVLRGGLTPKHIDVPELLKVLNFRPRKIKLLDAKHLDKTEKVYASLAEEFVLSVIKISNDDFYQKSNMASAEILLCTEGDARLEDSDSNHRLHIKRGDSAIVFAAAESYFIKGNAVLFKAAVPP